ncbi:Thiosulfate sulfurtransferase rdl2, mitochondrial [Gnomoniopsis smithogilvyi]|uniref:Thiosulfate sulfurtransferase rdl2, mitochondrial n=1 Tax=Gnomoniopsis smithogilvyi TaxID=1191159 RepID=A0A9W8YRY5_9PEZI|nr:Thiosulfate sulfurtransferase rdl2, mitochondrial [Gnomoniopsis smithogilvyi]
MSSGRALRPALNSVRQLIGAVGFRQYSIAAAHPALLRTARPSRPGPASATQFIAGTRRYSQQTESKIWNFEDVQKLAKQSKPEVVIVDVREPGELKSTGHIPHSINIPITTSPDSFHITEEEFEDRFGYPRPEKDQEVVFYCKAGVRSRAAAGLAREAGWEKVGEYPGSWVDWAGKGGDVER